MLFASFSCGSQNGGTSGWGWGQEARETIVCLVMVTGSMEKYSQQARSPMSSGDGDCGRGEESDEQR